MLVTPVLQKHYWHSYEETVKDIRQMFEQDLDRAYDSVYFAYLKQIDGLAACVPEKAFQEWSSKNREKNKAMAEAITQYQIYWGIK